MILLRQDDLATWAFLGSVLNVILSFALKQILNQERPVSEVCSGPGMPSTHAQSISFAAIFFILLSNHLYYPFQIVTIWFLIVKLLTLILILDIVIGWLGLNGLSIMLIVFVIAIGVYLVRIHIP